MRFTTVGKPWTEGREAEVERRCKAIQWVDIHDPGLRDKICCSAGLAIQEIIQVFRLKRVTHIAEDQSWAPECLLGIRVMNGDKAFEVFVIDRGNEAVPICVTGLEEANATS